MKQHIAIDQLNELSEKGKERLLEWGKRKDYWQSLYLHLSTGGNDLPNIGQMIEFLDEKEQFSSIGAMMKKLGSDYYWEVDANLMGEFDNDELCDALWKAVKEVVEIDKKKKID